MTSRGRSTTGSLRRWPARLLVVLWIAAFVATHLPKRHVPETHVSDRTLHAVGYFLLGGLFLVTLIARGVGRIRRVGIALAVLCAYAAFDEITQPLVSRHASLWDWLADGVGVVAAVLVCELAAALLKRRPTGARPG